jgi:hypothetical protein
MVNKGNPHHSFVYTLHIMYVYILQSTVGAESVKVQVHHTLCLSIETTLVSRWRYQTPTKCWHLSTNLHRVTQL